MKKNKNLSKQKIIIIGSILLVVGLFLVYYLTLPIFNFGNVGFYGYLWFFIAFVLSIISIIISDKLINKNLNKTFKQFKYDKYSNQIKKQKVSSEEKFSKTSLVLRSIFGSLAVIILFTAYLFYRSNRHSSLYTETLF